MTASRPPALGPAPGQVQASGEGSAGRVGEAGLPALLLGPCPFDWHMGLLCVRVHNVVCASECGCVGVSTVNLLSMSVWFCARPPHCLGQPPPLPTDHCPGVQRRASSFLYSLQSQLLLWGGL